MGTIIARGNLKSVQVEGSGVSKIYLKGSMRSVYVRLAGISEVFVDPSSGTAAARSQPHIQLQHNTDCLLATDAASCLIHRTSRCHIHSMQTSTNLAHLCQGSGLQGDCYVNGCCICLCVCPAEDVKISGSVDPLSKVHYTRGQCDMGQVRCHVLLDLWLSR